MEPDRRANEIEHGVRLYRQGRSYGSIAFYPVYVRIGWRRAQRADRHTARVDAGVPLQSVVDVGRLDMMRRGGGNRSGTGGKKGTMSR